jgi:hypothetical protein
VFYFLLFTPYLSKQKGYALLTVTAVVFLYNRTAVRENIKAMYVSSTALVSLVRSVPTALPMNVVILMMNVPQIAVS